jgi:hypothetical protein
MTQAKQRLVSLVFATAYTAMGMTHAVRPRRVVNLIGTHAKSLTHNIRYRSRPNQPLAVRLSTRSNNTVGQKKSSP